MRKVTTFSGQPQYLQLLNLTNRAKIRKISRKEGYERYVKKLNGYTHFVALLFAVLMGYDSLRELVIGMMAEAGFQPFISYRYSDKRD
jgi:hypothetical protein